MDPEVDLVAFERSRIRGAIRTDFILSAEIIVLTLGTVAKEPWLVQLGVLCAVGAIMTVGVYGLVASIVKLDDLGFRWLRREGSRPLDRGLRWMGTRLIAFAPILLRFLSIAGTAAMFLVGGGIVTHQVGWLHHLSEEIAAACETVPVLGPVLSWLGPILFDGAFGILAGAVVLAVVMVGQRILFGAKPSEGAPKPASP
jgi:predicted DNA repair protein MutK